MSTLKPSLVPGVLAALVTIANTTVAAVDLPLDDPMIVLDGPARGDDLLRNYLVLGWSGQPDTNGVEAQLVDAGAGGRQREIIDVRGQLSVESGDDDVDVRSQAYAVLDALAAAIKADNMLGGTVTRAALREHQLMPAVGDGAICTVAFTVHVEGTR